jgi:hypothetical protein
MDLSVKGRPMAPAAAPAASIAATTPHGRLAALRERLTGRHHPPDEAA